MPIVVRALAIGVLGLALGYPGSGVEVILPDHAVCFLLAIPLLRLEPRVLALLAIASAVVVPVASHLCCARRPAWAAGVGRRAPDRALRPAGRA